MRMSWLPSTKKSSRESWEDNWLIREVGWEEAKQRFYEAIFALSNGYLGLRGSLEEIPRGSYPGTYIAGVYDDYGLEVPEIVNLPNPLMVEIETDAGRLGVGKGEFFDHDRILDMRNATLWRWTTFRDEKGRSYRYESCRFVSMVDPHLVVQHFSIRPLDGPCEIELRTGVDATTKNEMRPFGGPIAHYEIAKIWKKRPTLLVRTKRTGLWIAYSWLCRFSGGRLLERCTVFKDKKLLECFRVKIPKDKVCSIDRFSYIVAGPSRKVARMARRGAQTSASRGFREIHDLHSRKWREKWEVANVEIEGDKQCDLALRFCIYHLCSALSDRDFDVSIPAKALTGEWYGGHVFWDTEIFMLPFYALTFPHLAKHLLLYRYRRLDEARNKARRMGYAGALFPWESAQTGEEVTPRRWRDFNGRVVKVLTADREQHIASDVMYALRTYLLATGDWKFMRQAGAEMLFETARFWASRVRRNRKTGEYEIRGVIGPNEFQECVDNNAFTNYSARWCLRWAAEIYRELSLKYPSDLRRISRKIRLDPSEVENWVNIAGKIRFPQRPDGLIEEFDGYFGLKDVQVKFDRQGMPTWPGEVPLPEVRHTRLVKQADVVLLLALFRDEFDKATKAKNLDFYERRCVHKSSLSPAAHGLVAADIGDANRALRYFKFASCLDLFDLHQNTGKGIHGAVMGSAWQLAIFGFGGVRLGEKLSVNPLLPPGWHSIRFKLRWRGNLLEVHATSREVRVKGVKTRGPVSLEVLGKRVTVTENSIVSSRYVEEQ